MCLRYSWMFLVEARFMMMEIRFYECRRILDADFGLIGSCVLILIRQREYREDGGDNLSVALRDLDAIIVRKEFVPWMIARITNK